MRSRIGDGKSSHCISSVHLRPNWPPAFVLAILPSLLSATSDMDSDLCGNALRRQFCEARPELEKGAKRDLGSVHQCEATTALPRGHPFGDSSPRAIRKKADERSTAVRRR